MTAPALVPQPAVAHSVRARADLLGSRVHLAWSNPPASALPTGTTLTAVRVLRRERAYPLSEVDGDVVHDGPIRSSTSDAAVTPGIRYYYTVFTAVGGRWRAGSASRAHVLVTGHPDLPGRLFRLLPAVHQREDRPLRPDEIAALPAEVAAALLALPPALHRAGPLRRLLEAVLAPVAFARSTAEAIPQLRDVEQMPPEFLPLAAALLDVVPDRTLPLQRQRSEVRDAAVVLRSTGTVPHLLGVVTRVTGWQARVSELAQSIAREGHAPQGNLFARRPGTPWWSASDDVSTVLGFGAGSRQASGAAGAPAELTGTVAGPFTLRPGSALTIAVDGALPVTVRLLAAELVPGGPQSAADIAAVLDRRVPGLTAEASAEGRLRLRSSGGGTASSIAVLVPEVSLVSLEGAPRGRLAVADLGAGLGVRLVHAVQEPGGRCRLRGRAARDGTWSGSFPVPGPRPDDAGPDADPALVALPPAEPGGPGRLLLVWVVDAGSARARLRSVLGTARRPQPAVLLGERSSPLQVADGSWLVLTGARGRRRAARLHRSDLPHPDAPSAAEVATVLSARLSGLATADVAAGARLRLTSVDVGDDALLEVDLALSTAAAGLGLDGPASTARGSSDDELDWREEVEVLGAGSGRVADPAAAVDPAGRVVLAWAQHEREQWQVRTASWDGAGWSEPEVLSAPASASACAPTVAVQPDGRCWVAWAARGAPGAAAVLRARSRAAGATAWDAEVDLVAGGGGVVGDEQPCLLPSSGGTPDVVFSSDRSGGRDIWLSSAGADPEQLTGGGPADGWPVLVPGADGPVLLHRSDCSVSLSSVGRRGGTDTGTLRRYAGTTSAVPDDLARNRAFASWDDQIACTPSRPDGAPLGEHERYTRGTVELHLSQVAASPLDAATAERLRSVLPRVVPATVRVLVRLAPPVHLEQVYRAGADLGERVLDRHPEIDRTGAVTEASAVDPGWATLRSAVPVVPPADSSATGTSARPGAGSRHRTWSRPPQ